VEKHFGELPKVSAEVDRLNQAFMNILQNAIEAIGASGRIVISAEQAADEVVLKVSDDGCGIAKEDLPHIFEPGFTTRGVGVGVGLGLPMAYRIVEEHGGSIDVRSECGEGTEVTVRLPVALHEESGIFRIPSRV
jgi:two-component system NtrC family sensor kinase